MSWVWLIEVMSFVRGLIDVALAQAVPLGEPLNQTTEVTSFREYIVLLYTWGARLAISLSILVVIWAGFLYMTSGGNPETTKTAKEYLTGAVIGIALIFLSYLILNTLSPQLVNPTS